VNLDAELLEILACPACKSSLSVDEPAEELVCTNGECGLAYPVRDDIPVLLVDEARKPGESDTTSSSSESHDDGESASSEE
jgi:hypothetical protein